MTGPGHCWLPHTIGTPGGAHRGSAAAPERAQARSRWTRGAGSTWPRPGPAPDLDWAGRGRGQRYRCARTFPHWPSGRREPGSGRGEGGGGGGASGQPGLRRRPRPCARLARGPAAMHPTPPGPLGDCLRDWEELQRDFQSIQVSAHAGVPLGSGVKGRAACVRHRELRVRAWGPQRRSRGALLSASLECPTEALFARAAGATPLCPAGFGPPARIWERGPTPTQSSSYGEWPRASEPAGPSVGPVTRQTRLGLRTGAVWAERCAGAPWEAAVFHRGTAPMKSEGPRPRRQARGAAAERGEKRAGYSARSSWVWPAGVGLRPAGSRWRN